MTEQSVTTDLRASLAELFSTADASERFLQNRPPSPESTKTSSSSSYDSSEDEFWSLAENDEIKEQQPTEFMLETDTGSMQSRTKQTTSEHPASTHPDSTSYPDASEARKEKRKSALGAIFKLFFKNAIPKKEKCIGCDKDTQAAKLIAAPCGHQYCQHCIRQMGYVALQNTDQFPVRCCSQQIPSRRVRSTMGSKGRETYKSRLEEYMVPPAERWYCPQTKCGRWIRPRYLKPGSRHPKCPYCRTSICPTCRDIAHESRGCTSDPGLAEVLEVARRQRWQRCFNCHAMIEKTTGCNHIQCTCSAEFCYQCGRRYPCHCRGTTVVVEDNTELAADPNFDATTVVAAIEQAEREVAEEAVRQQETAEEHRQAIQQQGQPIRRLDQVLFGMFLNDSRLTVGSLT